MTHSMTAFADSFEKAKNHADSACMKLTQPSEYQYQLRHLHHGYIVDAYCREDGGRKVVHNADHKGPQLKLPDDWNLFDLVKAAIKKWNPADNCNGANRLPPFDDNAKAIIQVDTHRLPAVPPTRKVAGGFLVRVRMPNGDGPIDIVLTEQELATGVARAFSLEPFNGRL